MFVRVSGFERRERRKEEGRISSEARTSSSTISDNRRGTPSSAQTCQAHAGERMGQVAQLVNQTRTPVRVRSTGLLNARAPDKPSIKVPGQTGSGLSTHTHHFQRTRLQQSLTTLSLPPAAKAARVLWSRSLPPMTTGIAPAATRGGRPINALHQPPDICLQKQPRQNNKTCNNGHWRPLASTGRVSAGCLLRCNKADFDLVRLIYTGSKYETEG